MQLPRPFGAALLLVACGCTPAISLRRIDDESWFARESRTALETAQPSERTRQFLRRESLLVELYEDSDSVLRRLHEMLVTTRRRPVALHLAELCYLCARHGSDSHAESLRYHLSAARYAWAYLFDSDLSPPPDGFDPAFRWACDFYNRSLGAVLRDAAARREQQPARVALPLLTGPMHIERGTSEFGWNRSDYSEVLVAFDYDVVGLAGLARAYGLGVPVILVRNVDESATSFRPPILDSMSHGRSTEIHVQQSYGATVLLRPSQTLCQENAKGAAPHASIEIYDPTHTTEVKVGGIAVPLEADLTSPLAYTLARSHTASGLRAFFDVDESLSQVGLEMFQRFDPDKIPVIFVHGLLSSPQTWMHLFNDLLADPELRARFQFWFFRYPTGNPIAISAALLRETLTEVARRCDPDRKNPAFQDAVIVGHSMGGLLTRLQLVDGGERAWKLVSDRPLDELDVSDQQKAILRRIIYFERLPFLRRAVFMATPHRGAQMATAWYSRLGQKLVTLPQTIYDTSKALVQFGREQLAERLGAAPGSADITGIAGLSPVSIIATEVSRWSFPPDLPIHSIIGNQAAAGTPGGTDGIVAYESSHLDGVESELIVKSGHNVQEHEAAVRELIRILREHLAAHDAQRATAAEATAPAAR